jgi:CRISPR-associated protein (TIGR02584 family)
MQKRFKEILIFVIGTTPQIITETIYALLHNSPPVYPDEIYVLTTSIGKEKIIETLINKKILQDMLKEYEIPEIPFTKENIIVARDSEGKEIEDIRTREDNEAIGELIIDFIRRKTLEADSRLHCSLAGGRKTMSFYLGSALQLFGRPQDRLYHVLVPPEFESNPDFFYIPKKHRQIQGRLADGTSLTLSTESAKIELADLPFIKLSGLVKINGKSFRELIESGQKDIDTSIHQPQLRVHLKERTLYIDNTLIELVPVHLMIYVTFLRQKLDYCKYPEKSYCHDCTDCYLLLVDLSSRHAIENMAKDYTTIYNGQPFKAEELLSKYPNGFSLEQIRQYITKINKSIKEQYLTSVYNHYLISSIKKYGASRYGVRLDKTKIKIEA